MKPLTKNRADLLRLFFTNPEKSFYMHEIGRILGKKPGFFQRTINSLESEGILMSEYRANARYFRVNKEYPLYKELKSIVFKTVGIGGGIKDKLQKFPGIKLAFIYGSYAKRRENYLSDIDLIIIGELDEDKLIKELDHLEQFLKREINYKLYSLFDLKQYVKSGDPFLQSVLKDKKILLIGEDSELQKITLG